MRALERVGGQGSLSQSHGDPRWREQRSTRWCTCHRNYFFFSIFYYWFFGWLWFNGDNVGIGSCMVTGMLNTRYCYRPDTVVVVLWFGCESIFDLCLGFTLFDLCKYVFKDSLLCKRGKREYGSNNILWVDVCLFMKEDWCKFGFWGDRKSLVVSKNLVGWGWFYGHGLGERLV